MEQIERRTGVSCVLQHRAEEPELMQRQVDREEGKKGAINSPHDTRSIFRAIHSPFEMVRAGDH